MRRFDMCFILITWSLGLGVSPLLGQSTSASQSPTRKFEERLRDLVGKHRGKVTIAIKHLVTGETFFLDADDPMPTASLIKFPIMLETYLQASEGKIKLSDMVTLKDADKVPGAGILTYHFSEGTTFPLRDAVRLMMVYSDNTATNLVLDKIGIPSTNERMKAWKCENTRVHAKVFLGSKTSIDPERTKKFGLGSTTAREMITLLEKVHRGEVVSAKVCEEMLGHMKKCDDKEKLKRFLPAGTVVAHKTGSVTDVKTDAGIIYAKTGPLAICVLTNNNADKRFVPENEANILIGRVAELAVAEEWKAGKK